jgi:hypothetical protein
MINTEFDTWNIHFGLFFFFFLEKKETKHYRRTIFYQVECQIYTNFCQYVIPSKSLNNLIQRHDASVG